MASKSPTKSDIISSLSAATSLDKKTVKSVIDALPFEIITALKGPGEFTLPGVVKLKANKKAATVDRPGINPFTKEATTIKGKPASLSVRAAPVKTLKEAVAG